MAISFLEPIYPFVWLDAIHYKIKDSGKYVSKAVYTILGVNINTRSSLRYIASKDSVLALSVRKGVCKGFKTYLSSIY